MSKATVLIVEDEAIVATDLTRKLQRLGYEVVGIASEGEEAVALALSLRPQLVLMDIRLEGSMDGIAAAEAIRSRYDVPVIYLTALSDAATLARAKLTDPFGYILKPFEERELAAQVQLALYKHQADRKIREQAEWLRVTLTSIGDAVITCDTQGRITFLNPVAEALTDWRSEEAMGQPLTSVFCFVNEHTGQTLEEPVTRVLREGRAVPLANHAALITRDGRTVPIEGSAASILDTAGQVIGAVLVFQDVTGRRRAEEALKESEDRFRALFDQAPIPYQSLDEDGCILMANQAWLDTLGYTRDEVVGKWFGSFLAAPCVGAFQERFPCFKGQGEVHGVEFEMLRKDGRHIFVSFDGRVGKKCDGSFKQTHCIFTDITTRRRMEEELRKSRDELELRVQERTAELDRSTEALRAERQRFSDVLNVLPVYVVLLTPDYQAPFANKVFRQRFGESRGLRCFEHLFDRSEPCEVCETYTALKTMKPHQWEWTGPDERIYSVLQALLDYSRISSKAEPMRSVDLNALLRDVIEDLDVRIAETAGAVEVEILPCIEADPHQMRQLFQNLIGNALKFHREGEKPVVRIATQPSNDGRTFEIRVEDNGIGFDDRSSERIFAPFHRLHGRSSGFEGTGMGLAICKKIVERHGGSITAKSAPGLGSTFIINLPAKQDSSKGVQ